MNAMETGVGSAWVCGCFVVWSVVVTTTGITVVGLSVEVGMGAIVGVEEATIIVVLKVLVVSI